MLVTACLPVLYLNCPSCTRITITANQPFTLPTWCHEILFRWLEEMQTFLFLVPPRDHRRSDLRWSPFPFFSHSNKNWQWPNRVTWMSPYGFIVPHFLKDQAFVFSLWMFWQCIYSCCLYQWCCRYAHSLWGKGREVGRNGWKEQHTSIKCVTVLQPTLEVGPVREVCTFVRIS